MSCPEGSGDWQSTMALFNSLEQVVSFKEGTFPENMLFQGLLIPESSLSQRETPSCLQGQECGGRAGGGAGAPDSWVSRLFPPSHGL